MGLKAKNVNYGNLKKHFFFKKFDLCITILTFYFYRNILSKTYKRKTYHIDVMKKKYLSKIHGMHIKKSSKNI